MGEHSILVICEVAKGDVDISSQAPDGRGGAMKVATGHRHYGGMPGLVPGKVECQEHFHSDYTWLSSELLE